jgi:hypothetical protein
MPSFVPPEIDVEQLVQLKDMILRLEEALTALKLQNGELTMPGEYIFQLFAQVNLNQESYPIICEVIDVASQMLVDGT